MKHLILKFILYTSRIWPDKIYIKLIYFIHTRRFINLTSPQLFIDKMNWLKLFDHNPLYVKLVDKYEVKSYVSKLIGEEYVVPCYGVYNNIDEIPFSNLPDQFVIKSTHDSSGAYIVTDKSALSIPKLKKHYHKVLKENYFFRYREWPYKFVKPRIIIDKFLLDNSHGKILDYKFYCFDGTPHYMYITIKGKDEIFENFYDMDFNPVEISHGFKRHYPEFKMPRTFLKMKLYASKLSANIPFVRIDFFEVNNCLYFGEFTFYDWGAMNELKNGWDEKIGRLVHLPQIK